VLNRPGFPKGVKVKYLWFLVTLLMITTAITGCRATGRDVLYQTSPFIALNQGDFDGTVSCGELKKHGDTGLGTFNNLDGEMIMIDGRIYQVKIDGIAYPVNDSEKTPFAIVTYLDNDWQIPLDNIQGFDQLQKYLDDSLPTENIIYAFTINGTFDYIKARSVPPQSKPYPTLTEAVKNQRIFEFNNISGTIVGFRCPAYVGNINVPGYHFHFITSDRKAGGHLLDCNMSKVTVEVDNTNELFMAIPLTEDFSAADFSLSGETTTDKAEK
jgi:acetolactate decarboxylase